METTGLQPLQVGGVDADVFELPDGARFAVADLRSVGEYVAPQSASSVPFGGWRLSRRRVGGQQRRRLAPLGSREEPAVVCLFVLECLEDVEPRSTACGQNRSEDSGDHGDRGEDHELGDRDVERDALARETSREDRGEEDAEW